MIIITKQINYWKSLTRMELRVVIIIMLGVWAKIIKMLIGE